MNYEHILYEKEAGIVTVTFNRPKSLNALIYPMLVEIRDAIAEVKWDDEVRVLVFTGAGRAFCAGDDLKGMFTPPRVTASEIQQKVVLDIRNLRKPVIAAVNGNAHGAGADIMLASDFRIASDEAILGDIRTKRALFIGTGTTYMLPALVGLSKAIELLFTGDLIDAWEAEKIGLVNKTVPAADFKAEVKKWADKMACAPTKMIGVVKAEIYRHLTMNLAQSLESELTEMGTPWYGESLWTKAVEDTLEGFRSFAEKRPPKFTGQ